MKKAIIQEILAGLLMAMFLYASFSKYFSFAEFERAMYRQPFPHWFGSLLILAIPPIEILISLLLIFERKRGIAFRGAAILMGLFTLYIATILMGFFPKVPCSCGGIIKRLTWGQHLIFNIIFFLIALAGAIIQNKKDRQSSRVGTAS